METTETTEAPEAGVVDKPDERVKLTLPEAIAYAANTSYPLDTRFEVAVSLIASLLSSRDVIRSTLMGASARVGALEAANYVMLRHLIGELDDEEQDAAIQQFRAETDAFAEHTAKKVLSIWSYVRGASLEEATMTPEEVSAARELALREAVERQMQEAAAAGEPQQRGECEAHEECSRPYECTLAQRCLDSQETAKKDA